jgi:L-malate glycosyltransferase
MYLDSPAGGFKAVYEYANRLQLSGHQITVIHPRNLEFQPGLTQFAKSYLWQHKIASQHKPLVPWFEVHPKVSLRLIPDLREQFIPDADAIFATAYDTAFHVSGYTANKGHKFYLLQAYETWQGAEDKVKASWQLPLHKVVISRWLLDIARELGEAERTTYIPYGLNFSHFRITTPVTERLAPRVAMLAHPHKNKGVQDGLEALQTVKARVPKLEAVLFGTQARSNELPAWIEYVQQPTQEKLLELYNSCRVFLNPSWTEGWGLPATEAAACGCALVSADNGGIHEFAIHNETALIVPIKQPQLLAEALLKLLTDRALCNKFGAAGARWVQQFTWERAVDALEKLLLTSV